MKAGRSVVVLSQAAIATFVKRFLFLHERFSCSLRFLHFVDAQEHLGLVTASASSPLPIRGQFFDVLARRFGFGRVSSKSGGELLSRFLETMVGSIPALGRLI